MVKGRSTLSGKNTYTTNCQGRFIKKLFVIVFGVIAFSAFIYGCLSSGSSTQGFNGRVPASSSSSSTASSDTIAPTVTNVTSSTANGTYTAPSVISIQIEFSEAVVVAGGTPTLLLETGATDQSAVYSSGSGTSTLTFDYTIQGADSSLDLDYFATNSISLVGATIKDAAGNNAVLTLPAPGDPTSLAGNKALVIDIVPTTALAVAVGGTTQNRITWATVVGAASYNLYWSTSTGVTKLTGTQITGVAQPYTHTPLVNGTTYYYVLTAVVGGAESGESAEFTGTPLASRTIFVTSTSHTANMGGLSGANGICAARATAAGLTGSYKAYLSTSATDASCNLIGLTGTKAANCGLGAVPFDSTAPINNRNSTNITSSQVGLFDANSGANTCGAGKAICNGVGRDESNNGVAGAVRTASVFGIADWQVPGTTYCVNWTSTADANGALYGTSFDTNNWWQSAGWGNNCSSSMPIYCVQQ